jgi:orotate phosphoribosyltransferase
MLPAAMAGNEAEQILRDSGALLAGDHFVYISGQHGSGWIDKDAVYPHTERTSALAKMIAEAVGDDGIEVVCGPATGGLIIAPVGGPPPRSPRCVRRARRPASGRR